MIKNKRNNEKLLSINLSLVNPLFIIVYFILFLDYAMMKERSA